MSKHAPREQSRHRSYLSSRILAALALSWSSAKRAILFGVIGLICGFSQAQGLRATTSPSLPPGALVRIDSNLGVAIFRNPDGEYQALRLGEEYLNKSYRLVRIYRDRVELEKISTPVGSPQRFWLSLNSERSSGDTFTPTQQVLNRNRTEAPAGAARSLDAITVPVFSGANH